MDDLNGAKSSTSLTSGFNLQSVMGHTVTHIAIMGLGMALIGMPDLATASIPAEAFTEAATQATGEVMIIPDAEETYNLGNLLVQTGHGAWEMTVFAFEAVSGFLVMLGDLVTNTFNGNIMPTTSESFVMDHLSGGSMEHATGHAAHVGLELQIEQFSEWTAGLSPDELAEIKDEANAIYGQTLFEYFQGNFLDHG